MTKICVKCKKFFPDFEECHYYRVRDDTLIICVECNERKAELEEWLRLYKKDHKPKPRTLEEKKEAKNFFRHLEEEKVSFT